MLVGADLVRIAGSGILRACSGERMERAEFAGVIREGAGFEDTLRDGDVRLLRAQKCRGRREKAEDGETGAA